MYFFRFCVIFVAILVAQNVWAQRRAASVDVQPVEQQIFAETVPVFAQVVTARDGEVAGRISGSVNRVYVLAGDRVQMGDPIIELNTELLLIQLNQSQAQIVEAQAGTRTAAARLASAQISFDRISRLANTSSFSQVRFEELKAKLLEARSQLAEADAREKIAEARLAETAYQLDRSTIAAPFSGVIVEVLTIPGAFIQSGTPVVRVLDTSAFEVRASVPSRYVEDLSKGTTVMGQTESGVKVELTLRAVLPIEDPSTRTRAVLFSTVIDNDNVLVALGQSITVDVPIGEAREMLSVPKDALVQSPGGWTAFVAVNDKAQPRSVTIGVPVGNRYEVLDGLNVGDLVVVRGNERLRPMQDIAPTVRKATQ